MTQSVPTNEPAELIAGRTWKWTRDLADYPAGTWTLRYYFKRHDHYFSVVATAVGMTHSVTVDKATTAQIRPGRYRWQAYAEDATESYVADEGMLEVLPDFSVAGNREIRTHAQRMLEALEATLEGRASRDQLAMTINGRSISRTPIEELRRLRDRYRQEVKAAERAERIANGLATSNSVRVRF